MLPRESTLATQVRPKGVKKKRGLTPHEQRLEDLDIVVQWALRGRVALVDVVDIKGAMVDLHCDNVRDSWGWMAYHEELYHEQEQSEEKQLQFSLWWLYVMNIPFVTPFVFYDTLEAPRECCKTPCVAQLSLT